MGVLVKVAVAVRDGVAEAEGVTVAVGEAVGELPPRTLGAVTSMETLRRIVRELVATMSFTAKGTILGTIGVYRSVISTVMRLLFPELGTKLESVAPEQ